MIMNEFCEMKVIRREFSVARNPHQNGVAERKNRTLIEGLENHISLKVKVIRSDNGTKFKNSDLNQFCGIKGIKREFSVPRTPQQNSIAERKNKTLIEAARTMLVDSLLPIPFWAEAVNTACYVQNRVCPVTILNTLDHLGKFDRKSDDGFFIGYSINSKAFRVFNTRTRFVGENLHITFLENKPNVPETGPNWMIDIDALTMSMNHQPVFAWHQTNGLKSSKDMVADDAGKKRRERAQRNEFESMFEQDKDANGNRMFTPVSAAGSIYVYLGGLIHVNAATLPNADLPTDPLMPDLEDTADTRIFSGAYDDEV
nr:hypothetical protein [Tanacetum cinerariifolium]GFB51681.1 hypothetical protein [Tanacetum cinerariifolium]